MPATLDDKLVVAISSRALFDLEEENQDDQLRKQANLIS